MEALKTTALMVLATLTLSCIPDADAARILAVLPIIAPSHHRFFQPVLRSLAEAGHHLVVYTPYPINNPPKNYTEVILHSYLNEKPSMNISRVVLEMTNQPHWKCLDIFIHHLDPFFSDFKRSGEIKSLLASKDKFDLIITEVFASQEFILVFGHIFKAPVIALQPFPTNNILNSIFGNDLSLSYIPDSCAPFSNKMSFLKRLMNSLFSLRGLYYIFYYKYVPLVTAKTKNLFPDLDLPPLLDMMANVSLVFVNDHMTSDYARPRTPNIIPIGGIHIEETKQLPNVLQKFMDESEDGVILFSLGTYVPDELQPQEYFDTYIRVFRQLKQRVLWKTRKEDIKGLPSNVMTSKWLPQRDVLGHPNTVLFITHGGQHSTLETIHSGVPVVCIPQFNDQHRNCALLHVKGVGIRINIKDVSESTVLKAIHDVLYDSQYKTTVQKLSRIFRDQPMSPAQTVVFWTEYVLRHQGAPHLKPASTLLSWYQLYLLDVIAVLLISISIALTALYFITSFLLGRVRYWRKCILKEKNT